MAAHPPTTGRKERRPATRLALASIFAAAALIGLVATPSSAGSPDEQDQTPPEEPKGWLHLSITHLNQDSPFVGETNPTIVSLYCGSDTPSSTHPSPGPACKSLYAVGGDFEKLPSHSALCPAIYDPVRVQAAGLWGPGVDIGNVAYTAEFANRCVAAAATDYVFEF